MMDGQDSESAELPQMLPPPPGRFASREELIEHVGDFAVSQGYVVIIKKSKKDRLVVLGCDRGGMPRDRRKTGETESAECVRKRKSKLTNCPFELLGKWDDGVWFLTVKDGTHNHEPLKDISEHPAARQFTEDEVLQIKEMTDAGLKPRQILKKLKQSNPDLLSTPKHVYNVKTKIRQGNLTVKNYQSLRLHKASTGISQCPVATEPSWRQRFALRVPNFIGGRFVDSQSIANVDVINPATQQVVAVVHFTTMGEFKTAVYAAKRAFPSWRNTPVTTRQRIMFQLRELIQRDMDKIASCITSEEGKPLKDAYRDVYYGLEVLEHACGATTSEVGHFVSNVANGVDLYNIREPLGVCAGICQSNFPAIIALWMFPLALMCGNTFILKPSVKNPGVSLILAELALAAGLPTGVLNIVHGTDEIANIICDDDDVKAVSFAGSRTVGMHVHSRALAKGKGVQSYIEGRSHMVVMPDAHMNITLAALFPVAFGTDGERCFALSTVIFVGDSKPWESKLIEQAMTLKVNAGTEPDVDVGPVISKQEKEKICRLIQSGIESGARLILDGRNIMADIYGPVLLCMQAKSLEDAISIINQSSRNCNGACICTTSGASAKKFQTEIEVGQVGVNVPVSVPTPFISSSDSEASLAGQVGTRFYTKMKTVRQQWNELPIGDDPTDLQFETSRITELEQGLFQVNSG